MPIYKLKLLARKEIAHDIVEFIFEKPEGFTFRPGQYGGFTLINPKEADVNHISRRFSLLSGPDNKNIIITTRMQNSPYKRGLNELAIGSEIKFAGPTGNFVLHDDETIPAVLIAGGIGITPFYCMLNHAIACQSKQAITLFYGNQSPKDAAYLSELQQMEMTHPHFKLVATMANPDNTWQGETGFISYQLIKKNINDLTQPIYYVCGSPAMVSAMHEILDELGIPEDRIKTEDFPGY